MPKFKIRVDQSVIWEATVEADSAKQALEYFDCLDEDDFEDGNTVCLLHGSGEDEIEVEVEIKAHVAYTSPLPRVREIKP